jgi:hypothetical protein
LDGDKNKIRAEDAVAIAKSKEEKPCDSDKGKGNDKVSADEESEGQCASS